VKKSQLCGFLLPSKNHSAFVTGKLWGAEVTWLNQNASFFDRVEME